MPIFEYACEKCGHQFDVLMLSSRDPDPVCPSFKHEKVKKMMSAGTILGSQKTAPSAGACAPQGGG